MTSCATVNIAVDVKRKSVYMYMKRRSSARGKQSSGIEVSLLLYASCAASSIVVGNDVTAL